MVSNVHNVGIQKKKIMVTDISFENFKNIKNLNLLYFKLEVTLNQHFP